jgi:IS30 family transposase
MMMMMMITINKNYKTGGICRQEGRPTNTGCQNTQTQHRLSSVTARRLKTEVQRDTREIKNSIAEKTKERWHGKRMHGQLPRNLDEKLMDIEQSYRWLKSGDIKGETDGTIVPAKDQSISTKYFKNKIL